MKPGKLKKIRSSMGYSQREMAKKLGKPKTTYQRIENGERAIQPVEILQVYLLRKRQRRLLGIR